MTIKNVIIAYDFAVINGGQAKVAIDSAVLLANSGINVTYFAAVGPVEDMLRHENIDVVLLNQNDILTETNKAKAMARGIWNIKAAIELKKLCAKFDPKDTILHCHGYAKALSPSIGPVLTHGSLPSVYTMHEYFLACPNGGFYDYQKNEICTRKALGTSCLTTNCDVRHPAHKAWRVARQFATWGPAGIPKNMRDIIYISQTQKNAMEPYISKNSNLHYLPNPVDFPQAPDVDVQSNDIYLFIGRLNPEKGGLLFAKAAKEAGVKAVFVGDGPEADAIMAANPDAVITGWQTRDQVQEWIGKARALVFPSLWYETFGLVACEALAQGVPVVCGSWNSAAEFIADGQNGAIFKDDSVTAVTNAIIKVQAIGSFDTGKIRQNGSSETHLEKLLGIYQTLQA